MKPPAISPLLGIFLFAALAAGAAAAPPARELPPEPCPFPPGCNGGASEMSSAAAAPQPSAAPQISWPGAAALVPALASADCAAELVAAGPEEPTGVPLCGACSQEPCAHAEIGSVCGSSGGELKFCIYDGDICRHSGDKCNCRLGPI